MKIAIFGTAPYHKNLGPMDDHSWETWVCSPGNRRIFPRVTRWFELHGIDDCKGPENADWNTDYFAWLREQKFPVYMQEPNDLVPQARVFPIRAWLKEFDDWGRMAATSSISLMIGYAIMEGAEEIAVFGVDMAATEEAYGGQKTGCQIMLKIAKDRGINVQVPLSSCLATPPPLYGYAEASRMGRKLAVREQALKAELAQVEQNFQNIMNHRENLRGQLDAVSYVRRTFVDGAHDAELDVEEVVQGQKGVLITNTGTAPYVGRTGTQGPVFDGMRAVEVPRKREAPTVVEDMDPNKVRTETLASGLLVPAKTNSGEHPAEV